MERRRLRAGQPITPQEFDELSDEDLEPKEELAGAAAYTRSVRIFGLGRGDKEREEVLEIRSLNNARGVRGRKGKVADLGFKPLAVMRVE